MRDLPALWSSETWRRELEAWLLPALEAAGRTVTGPLVQERVRFWSTVLHVETDRGRVWVKENAPSQAFEAGLVATVERLAPGRTAPLVAVEPGRGWLATADLGRPLGERADVSDGLWVGLVAAWATLQHDLAGHPDALLATGLTALPESDVAAWAAALADRLAALPADDPRRMTGEERAEVERGMPRVVGAAATLVASGLPPSLQHNDLHLGNAVGSDDAAMAFIDLGDALWAHPLTAFRIPLWILADRLGDPGAPLVGRVVDAALAPWSGLLAREELRALLPAADRVSCLHRAVSWQRLVDDVPVGVVPVEFHRAAVEWLLVACDPDPFARATGAVPVPRRVW